MPEDRLLPFQYAAQEIERRLGLTPGAAQSKLREFCAGGIVRSWKQPYSEAWNKIELEGPQERIVPVEWRQTEIDLVTDADGCSYFVDVSVIDLEGQLGPIEDNPRNVMIMKLLKAGKRPGSNVLWKVFCDTVRKECDKSPTDRGYSDETIENVTKKIGHFG